MAIRLPLKNVLTKDHATEVGAGSVNGGVATTFTIPQDTDNVAVKFTASTVGGGVSVVLQTTDDGGTTWYDLGRTSIVSNANGTTAQWLNHPVIGIGVRSAVIVSSVVAVGSVQSFGSVYGAIGSAAASSLGQLEVSGLPILSQQGRIFLRLTSGVSANALSKVEVLVNNQSATA